MYSSAGPRASIDTLREFEQVRGFFLQLFTAPPGKPLPVRLVAFGSPKEFDAYRFNEFATAYYHDTPDRDYIVMSHAGSDIFPVAVHEYVHLLARHSGLKLPPWINEGLAEVYSTLRPQGNKILVGDLILPRMRALMDGKWVPLEIILGATHDSPYYNEKNKAGSLYNEGWALTHMLFFRTEYRPKFSQLVLALSNGKDSVEALNEIYGKTLGQIDKDLQSYLRSDTFKAILVPAKLDKITDDIPAEPVSEFDSGLMLSDLLTKEAEHRTALEHLIELDPKRAEPYRALGYIEWRAGKTDEARRQFGLAFERGDREPGMLWDYGRLMASDHGDVALQAFSALLEKDAARVDVRLRIADLQLRDRNYRAVIQTLGGIRSITPQDASHYFRLAVYAHLQLGEVKDAEETVKHALDVAKTDADRATAELLMSDVKRRTATPVTAMDTDMRPVLRRNGETAPPSAEPLPIRVAKPTISGQFVELECHGKQARMILETAAGRKAFLIDDPEKVIITGKSDWQVDMTCGPQKNRASVDLAYEAPAANQAGIDGIVRSLVYK
jgi:tetratricopeptide (TPR) repeat protein